MSAKTKSTSSAKGGRPALSPDERLSETVHCRMTTAELEHVRTQASLAGMHSVSEFLRHRANSYRIHPPANRTNDPELVMAIDNLTREVKAIGRNYNQLLVSVHRGRNVNEPMATIHEQIEAVLDQATAALQQITGGR